MLAYLKHSWRSKLPLILLVIIAVVALYKLIAQVRHEALGSFHSDVGIYLAVSRGIVNGLVPYRDLFETKPPGIFFIGALSLRFFQGPQLLLWIGALLIGAIPALMVIPFLTKKEGAAVAVAFLFGTLLAFYTADKAGQGLSESFGAAFVTAFIVLAALRRERFSRLQTALGAFLLFCATGIKEPFFIVALGGAILVSPSFRSLQRLVPSVIIAIVAGVLALAATRTLGPYLSIYLPHMVGHQIGVPWGTVADPWWLRTISLPRQWEAMWSFSMLLPAIIATLWIATLVVLVRSSDRGWHGGLQWLVGSWLLTLAVGISGDFYGHQFIFTVPGFIAMFLVCARRRDVLLTNRIEKAVAFLWTILVALSILLRPTAGTALGEWTAWENERKTAAAAIDAAMDACEVDRYLLLINSNDGIYAYTKHSPYGPLFTQYARFIAGRPIFIETFGQQFHTAPLAVYKDDELRPLLDEESVNEFYSAFTEKPWPCAGKNFEQPIPYHILFRKGAR